MFFSLDQLGLLDSPPEEEYDNLTSLAAGLLNVPVAHVSIADHDEKRIFYKSQHGHPDGLAAARQLPMELTYCQHVALNQAIVVVTDAREDALVKGTPAQKEGPLAYLGLPVKSPDGHVVGGLCLMQPEPREWTEAEINTARMLASCVSDLIKLKTEVLTSEQLRREQKQFTYAISHDLKSPANTLHLIFNEIALNCNADTSPDTRMLLKEGLGTVTRMKQQVEDILQYSRTIDLDEASETVALSPLVEETLHNLKAEITAANANVSCEELPEVFGNRLQLTALFQNLISNALKFSAPGRNPVVTITATKGKKPFEHRVTVKDNGIGIAPENHQSIFKLFTRLHLREQYPGTGIGLALCHRVMENHNGSISVTSEENKGSAFTVNLSDRRL